MPRRISMYRRFPRRRSTTDASPHARRKRPCRPPRVVGMVATMVSGRRPTRRKMAARSRPRRLQRPGAVAGVDTEESIPDEERPTPRQASAVQSRGSVVSAASSPPQPWDVDQDGGVPGSKEVHWSVRSSRSRRPNLGGRWPVEGRG